MKHRQYVGDPAHYDLMTDWQFDYVTNLPEVTPATRFLDLGCGSLRLGKKLIPWLNEDCYTGLDRSWEAIQAGLDHECDPEHIRQKNPQFVVTDVWDFDDIHKVDVIWAQAVFNHINLESIGKCMRMMGLITEPHTVFYFTYWPGDYRPLKDDTYTFAKTNVPKSFEQLETLFDKLCWNLEETEDKTILGQTICRATKQ
jgi:SAM-dependent methyltransferase